MPQVRVLGKGARITGGIFCLLFALHTWIWVLRDIQVLDFATTWEVWTGSYNFAGEGDRLAHLPATTPDDIGLGLLQLAAAFAAFTRAWTAGGLLAVTTTLTLLWRLPVLWHAGLHSESSPYYALRGFANDPSLDSALAGAVVTALLCVALGIVLVAGNRPWTGQPAGPQGPAPPYGPPQFAAQHPAQQGQFPQGQFPQGQPQPYDPPLPSESPQRPTGAHAAVAAALFGLMALFSVGWNIQALSMSGGGLWLRLMTGEGTLFTLLDVSPGFSWLTMILVGGCCTVLALLRGLSARGFSLGFAVALLPQAVTTVWAYIDAGSFFELGDAAPVAGAFSRIQLLLLLAGTVTLIVLTLRPGVAAQPGAAPAQGAVPPYGVPVQGQMQGGQMPGAPVPGGVQPYGAHAPGAPGFGVPGPGVPAPGAQSPFGAPPGQPSQAPPPPYHPPQPASGAPGQAFGPPPAQAPATSPAGPPPAGPPPAAPPAMPPGTPPPPAAPPAQHAADGSDGTDAGDQRTRTDGNESGEGDESRKGGAAGSGQEGGAKSGDAGGTFGPPPVY